jgi:hypothetical protein
MALPILGFNEGWVKVQFGLLILARLRINLTRSRKLSAQAKGRFWDLGAHDFNSISKLKSSVEPMFSTS